MFGSEEAQLAKAPVFLTTELIEASMMHVEPRNVIAGLLGTNKYFGRMVSDSIELQRKLWKRPLQVVPGAQQIV